MSAILANPPFSLLPKSIQEKFVQEVRESLSVDKEQMQDMRNRLNELEQSVKQLEVSIEDREKFLSFFPSEHQEAISSNSPQLLITGSVGANSTNANSEYQRDWTQPEKILYVLRKPLSYGNVPTFITPARVLDAIFQEEPELLKDEGIDWKKRYSEALSRLVTQRKIVPQMREKGTRGPLHYISPDWFENGRPKAEYKSVLAKLEIAPFEKRPIKKPAPATTGAGKN